MPKGGYKPGAGRPPKPKPEESKAPAGLTPLEYMLFVIHDVKADNARRDRMAIAAAPFCHERVGDQKLGKKELRAEAAKTAGAGTEWDDLIRPN